MAVIAYNRVKLKDRFLPIIENTIGMKIGTGF